VYIFWESIVAVSVDWTVRGSNPGGSEIFRTRPAWRCGPSNLLYNRYGVIPGEKAAGTWR